ncbi:MAG: helicase-related protein [Candidatus Velthaea sp.]
MSYSDNTKDLTVAQRLIEEIDAAPTLLDVVTGYLAPSAWEVLAGSLDKVGRFRLLLGKDYELASKASKRSEEQRIKEMVRLALREEMQAIALPTAVDADSVRRLLKFLSRPDTEVDFRVFEGGGEFLHAKAYILSGSVGVGSANFTASGLLRNRELVAWRQDRHVVTELNAWFDTLWSQGRPYKDELRQIISSSRFGDRAWTPFELLIRTLAERYGLELPKSLETARFSLKWFQEDAVFRLIRLLGGPAGGALLADAVGLGKTYMAMGVIHHFLYESAEKRVGRRKPVLVVVPASMRDTWADELKDKGMDWACDLITLQSLRSEFVVDEVNQADLVIIDEAHRLRGEGVWFQQCMRIVTTGTLNKRVLLLTATPVHTGVTDLTNLLRLMTKNRRDAWAPAIADFEKYLQRVEKRESDPFPVLDRSVVRRSRTDILRALQERQSAGVIDAEPLRLPKREPKHIKYAYGGTSPELFDVFAATLRDLELAPYDTDRFRFDNELFDTALYQPTASSLAGLFLAGLLKRFESSIRAVSISLSRLRMVLERSLALLAGKRPLFLEPKIVRAFITTWTEGDVEGDDLADEWDALTTEAVELDAESYDIKRMSASIRADIKRVQRVLQIVPDSASDGKVKRLRSLLTRGALAGKRVLVFTQFRDTAIYLHQELTTPSEELGDVGIVGLVHGGTEGKARSRIAGSFDPNHATLKLGEEPIRVLVATDVLAEGHNLQLAEAIVNFDLHWNPQVIVQRAGRIDRLNSPHDRVFIYSFLPEEGLDAHLNLADTIDRRFGRIHFLGLGDEAVTEFSQDVQTRTFEQIRRLYADDASVFDEIEQTLMIGSTDFMRQPLEKFLRETMEARLDEIPLGVQSVKALPADWKHGPGTFIAFRHGASERGETIWRFYSEDGKAILVDEPSLFHAIVCLSNTPRGDVPVTSGVLVDFDLLRRAAADVADAINRRTATASVARGASERSRKIRERLIVVAKRCDFGGDKLDMVLDRLDEVRIEDFDHARGYRPFMDALRALEKGDAKEDGSTALDGILEGLLGVIGSPSDSAATENKPIRPEDLVLVSWEKLIMPLIVQKNAGQRPQQMQFGTA